MSLEQKIAELMEQAKQLESIKSEEIEESEILDITLRLSLGLLGSMMTQLR